MPLSAVPRGRARVIRIRAGGEKFAAVVRVVTTGSCGPLVRLFKASVARCAAKRSAGFGRWKSVGGRLVDSAKKAFKAMGGELKHFYLTLGRYDIVLIGEHPNDETAARAALATTSMGNVRTETFRAFTEEEYRKLIKSLP